MNIIGLMSGTSLDGLDIAYVTVQQEISDFQLHYFETIPYPTMLREKIKRCSNEATATVKEICSLNFELSHFYVKAIKQFLYAYDLTIDDVELIGSHGQTIYHQPEQMTTLVPSTLQIGEPAIMAAAFCCPVIANFRAMDIAVGGQGAPLVPFIDQALFQNENAHTIVLNIGGISNITSLGKHDIVAFDTGPGNMVIDQFCMHFFQKPYDRNGTIASKGKINQPLLEEWRALPYFKIAPPKSTGRELFGEDFVAQALHKYSYLSGKDFIATATYFTALTIYEACKQYTAEDIDTVIVSGGGVYNQTLMDHLKTLFSNTLVAPSDDFGIRADAKEALYFALLAFESFHRRPNNLPAATGAKKSVVLGNITYF